jgi:ATP-dependent Clp protease protease subunit
MVPIVFKEGTYNCYISGDISEPCEYDELCYVLDNAEETTNVVLHINTSGGYIDSALKIIASLSRCQATVTARLTGTVASAGTIIALSCDKLQAEQYMQFMVHNYSTGTQGKGHEIMDYVNFNDKNLRDTFTAIYAGFLTEDEITDIIRGKDLWLSAEEVQQRWETK